MLGAVHVLPSNVRWRTPQILRARVAQRYLRLRSAGRRAIGAGTAGLIQANGYLPPGQSLRDELHPAALADYDTAVAASGLPPEGVNRERPWLAGIQLMFAQMRKLNYAASNGVDSTLMEEAARNHKEMRYFETIPEQFALLAPDDAKLELEESNPASRTCATWAVTFQQCLPMRRDQPTRPAPIRGRSRNKARRWRSNTVHAARPLLAPPHRAC